MLGCNCPVCRSGDPRNRRRRVSLLVEHAGATVLVDTSPDLREQLLPFRLRHLDGVLYTHGHADHSHGIDDLRPINYHMGAPIEAYGTEETLRSVRERFGYAFQPPGNYWARPCLRPRAIGTAPFTVAGLAVTPFVQGHGSGTTTGYLFGAREAAYSTDVDRLSDAVIEQLAGIGLWVVDCLGYEPHPSHAHLEVTLGWIARVRPKLAVLTHMSHQFDYERLRGELPSGTLPGHDGMVIDTAAL
jgi:phosphoribosyl 1,2-cyclic phosphate phosphodiesterase